MYYCNGNAIDLGTRIQSKSPYDVVLMGDSLLTNAYSSSYSVMKQFQSVSGLNCVDGGIGGTTASNHQYSNWNELTFHKLVDDIESGIWTSAINQATVISTDKALRKVEALSRVEWNKVNLLIINYGANDYTQSITHIDGTDFSSFKYSLKYGIQKIQALHPNIKIIVNTPLFRWINDTNADGLAYTNGETYKAYIDAVKDVCDECGVYCCDLHYESGIGEANRNVFLADGTHPNEAGCQLVAEKLWAKMNANFI